MIERTDVRSSKSTYEVETQISAVVQARLDKTGSSTTIAVLGDAETQGLPRLIGASKKCTGNANAIEASTTHLIEGAAFGTYMHREETSARTLSAQVAVFKKSSNGQFDILPLG